MSDIEKALLIAICRIKDMLTSDDGQAYKESRRVLPELEEALAAHEAANPEPVAWRYKYKFRDIGETGAYEYHSHDFACVARLPKGEPLYAAPVAAASPWLPIESAPKDGSLLLLKEKWEDEPFIGQWVSSAYGGKWAASRTHYDTDGNACVIDHVDSEGVTHWMPLPPAPEMKP
ncbi:Domain of unknown function DUF551 [uncultured Caudovirales phage]|uniref:DUF551 domain-containing protein n=1 Tax=uncultured Caudovirales phage TaxID=2100421 RepID=A0A6J5NJ10_9CAUD|nr:Domain of unknown function DUF551 [uncultured Caudovirales phage]